LKKKYIILLTLLFGLVVYMEGIRKEPLNWNISLNKEDKIPYGAYVTFSLMKKIFPKTEILENNSSVYELSLKKDADKNNIVYITDNFSPDKLETEKLLELTSNGANTFISSFYFNKNFLDTLKLKTINNFGYSLIPKSGIKKNVVVMLRYNHSDSDTFSINQAFSGVYFSSFDSSSANVLGYDENAHPNFLKISHGKGVFYIHSMPLIFSNYNQLYGSYEYAASVLSYLPKRNTIWDEYYKPGRKQIATPIRYILSQPSLKAAYILLLAGLAFYIIFEAKRRQKIIPILHPPENSSAEFAETVGKLYFNHADHRDIAIKKFGFFCEILRNRFNIQEIKFEEAFYKKLSEQTGADFKTVSTIFMSASFHKSTGWITENELIRFVKLLEKFKEQIK